MQTESSAHRSVRRTIQMFGGLFMIVGVVDLVIIELFPAYALKLFGVAIAGPSAFLIKLHSPAVHLLIGYGFLWLRPWAWGLSLAYAGFGVVSEVMNQAAFGFQYVRTVLIISTLCFALYVVWRRQWFTDEDAVTTTHPSTSEGAS